jgi:hypothetical protein
MAKITALTNTNTRDVDVIGSTAGTSYYKEAIVGRAGALDHPVASQRMGTHADDAAMAPATDAVVAVAGFADMTSPDSVDEGDIGALRMTLTRMLAVVSVADAAAVTAVASAATNTTLKAANTARIGLTIYNSDANALYVKMGATATTSDFSVVIPSGGYWEMPQPCYRGIVDGIWAADGSGSAHVTELT